MVAKAETAEAPFVIETQELKVAENIRNVHKVITFFIKTPCFSWLKLQKEYICSF
tara:strand:- start:151 stop:315 length:165 start_codon:yes stop_codon:yes gene_type:complete